jgi:hypothetical protein
MIKILNLQKIIVNLKQKYNCVGIKTSFEDEGADFREIIKLRTLTAQNNLKLSIKIGGCEAKTDIKNATDLCCDSIVVPMVESKYSLKKYINSTQPLYYTRGVNLETINALDNIDSLLTLSSNIDYFVIGRKDLVGSMEKKDVVTVTGVIQTALKKIKKTRKTTYMGGSLDSSSRDFVYKLYCEGLLDYIETRFVVMKLCPNFFNVWEEAIANALAFEIAWLEIQRENLASNVDNLSSRISLIRNRCTV